MSHAFARRAFSALALIVSALFMLGATPAVSSAADPASDAAHSKDRPTVEALLRRIEALERRLAAQEQATQAAQQAAVAAEQSARAAEAAARATAPSDAGAQRVAQGQGTAQGAEGQRAGQSTSQSTPPTQAQAPRLASGESPRTAPADQHPVAEQSAASATVSNPQIFAGPGGFSFQSPDGANQIRFHGEFDFDGRFYNDDLTPDGSRSTWLLRRARPIIEGTFANIFDFRFNPDFAGGKTVIQDAFVAARFNPLFVVTAGKFKEPFGLERLQLSPNNRFIELGLPSDLVPNRDLGIQVSGTYQLPTGSVTYQVGWFNGVSDGTSTDANATPDVDNNDDKDWVARVFALPFARTDWAALKGLGLGAAVSYVNQAGSETNTLLPSYKTETQRTLFGYDGIKTAADGTVTAGAAYADGRRLRYSPQAYYYYRGFGLLTEYVGETQEVARSFGGVTRRATVKPESWQVAATISLTGDDATFGTVKPKRPFVLGQPGWGAVELAARISELSLGATPFEAPVGTKEWFANPGSQANRAVAWTAGLNWYLTQNVAWYLDYTVTRFDGGAADGADRLNENAFFTRFQVAF